MRELNIYLLSHYLYDFLSENHLQETLCYIK